MVNKEFRMRLLLNQYQRVLKFFFVHAFIWAIVYWWFLMQFCIRLMVRDQACSLAYMQWYSSQIPEFFHNMHCTGRNMENLFNHSLTYLVFKHFRNCIVYFLLNRIIFTMITMTEKNDGCALVCWWINDKWIYTLILWYYDKHVTTMKNMT